MWLTELADEYAIVTSAAPKTRALHVLAITQFSRTLIRHAEVVDLTEHNLVRHATRRIHQGRAAATVAGEQFKLLALWRFACRQGYLQKWPTVPSVKQPLRVPRAWTQSELATLFKSLDYAQPVGTLNGKLWWRALFLFLYDSGERISAALSVEWANVDLQGLTVYIPAEERKGGAADRLYHIHPETAAALNELPRERRPFWFPFCEGTLYHRLGRMLLAVGLPSDRRSKFHRIRRTTASHYEAAGGNATELLGHTSRKVTRTYLDPRIVRPPNAVDLLFRPEPPPEL